MLAIILNERLTLCNDSYVAEDCFCVFDIGNQIDIPVTKNDDQFQLLALSSVLLHLELQQIKSQSDNVFIS